MVVQKRSQVLGIPRPCGWCVHRPLLGVMNLVNTVVKSKYNIVLCSYCFPCSLCSPVLPALSDGWVGGWMDGLGGESREHRKDRRRENREQKQGEQ